MFNIFTKKNIETDKSILKYWDNVFELSLRCGIELEIEYNDAQNKIQNPICSASKCIYAICKANKKECFIKDERMGTKCLTCDKNAANTIINCNVCEYNIQSVFAQNFPVVNLNSILLPSKNNRKNNQTGINEIKQDFSLKNGIEITTIGLPINREKIYQVVKNVTDIFKIYGSVENTCGLHFHILNEYYSNRNVAKPAETITHNELPAYILNNLAAIIYKFAPAIIFMGATGDRGSGINRYSTFASPVFPRKLGMENAKIAEDLLASIPQKGKYGLFNVLNSVFDQGILKSAHIEYRSCGMSFSPSYISALAVLFAAINYKAYKISRTHAITGVNVDKIMANLLLAIYNKGDGQRESDTRPLFGEHPFIKCGPFEKNIEMLSVLSYELIDFVSQEIDELDPTATTILERIIANPTFMLRIGGKNWEEIEQIYNPERGEK